jgi:hypothetical protein
LGSVSVSVSHIGEVGALADQLKERLQGQVTIGVNPMPWAAGPYKLFYGEEVHFKVVR